MKEFPENISQKIQFEQFVQTFIKGHEQSNQEDIEKIIQEIKILEKFSLYAKRFYCLFDHSKFYPVYLSENVEKEGGYSIDYILSQGLFFLFKRIHWKQLTLAYKVHVWGDRFQKLLGKSTGLNTEVWCCGVKFKDKWNKWRTVILKQKMLAKTKDNKALLSFIEAEEITAIYKADSVWFKASCNINGRKISRVYFSNGPKKESLDLLSPREIEILRLAMENKSNQKIGELLDISKNTVERHRKNMLARVGVKDMTALIRICQIAKVI